MSGGPRVTDAQVHVWQESTPERPWPPAEIPPQRVPALGVEELSGAMADAGVHRCLLVPPTWEGSRNDYVLAAAAADPGRFGALCRVDVRDPVQVEAVADWRSVPGKLGVRMSLNRGDVAGTVRAAIDGGFFSAAERHGLPVSVYAPGRHDLVHELADRFPQLPLTVDHLAVDSADRPLREAVAPLLALARHPRVAVKASALPCFVTESFPFPSITEVVYDLVESFGPERVFWGSDLSRLPCSYPELVEVFAEHLPKLSDHERGLVLGAALSHWLTWSDPSSGGPQ